MRTRLWVVCGLFSCLAWAACMQAGEPTDDGLAERTDALLAHRSFAVTEKHLIDDFTLERVLKQLVVQSGIPGLTPLDLFQQFWDTQNPAQQSAGTAGPHCDDQHTWLGVPGLNDFPWECPREEGFQAWVDPFGADPLYIPIGLFNRFDLAPANGSHCGEYRIVFAMRPGHELSRGRERNFIIFEAILPNPDPSQGLYGCVDVAKFWHDLSFYPDWLVRQELDRFYFEGLGGGFEPVVHVNHYGLMLGAEGYACSTGQIRTNQFNDGPWVMREYKLALDCRCGPCNLQAIPMTVKSNPYGDLFRAGTPEPLAPDLQNTLVQGIWDLSVNDLNRISYSVDDSLNAAESPIDLPNDYPFQAGNNGQLHAAIQAALPPGSPLNSHDIIERAMTQSCAGCHLLSDGRHLGNGLHWPHSLGFVHISEFIDQNGFYPISEALKEVFIPFREEILVNYLEDPMHYTFSGSKCEIELPPELEVNEELCKEAEKRPKLLTDSLESRILRDLRTKWESSRILGRSSGH